MSRGGRRRRHMPQLLTREQVVRAGERIRAGELVKQVYLDLRVSRQTLFRSLVRHGIEARGRPGVRPLRQQGANP